MEFEKQCERILAGFKSNELCGIISVRIESAESLFDPFDPSPAGAKNLNTQLESWLVDAIKEIKLKIPVKTRVIVSEESGITDNVRSVITRHFKRRAQSAFTVAKRKFRLWRFDMAVGVLFLAVCLAVSFFLRLKKVS